MLSFAEKLTQLIESVGKSDMSDAKLAAEITEAAGVKFTRQYIWELRTGKVVDPKLGVITALATYFEVKPSYFTDSSNDSKNSERLKLLAAMRNSGVEGLSLRATGLSDATIARVATILDSARELEGLDPISEPSDERPGQ
ncbi:ESX-1 secretion-associated regulator EspR [Mycobacteroides abscessus subsp. abscessus]|uniref:HTH cro/C1-type domain-containing protein n=1 Tax=Mycobacteroides immunogenum TaxID=83262 RepID=A0A179VCX4_9MYCO|nr:MULTISPECIES: hypothetical protein [Mycobacteriaceae]MBN7314552.1 hypothetical protein [Mycobacteroides abscessus subsp. abscessus]OAT69740.1 hypothetical protein AWB85_19540 [Mycobacteroides immunogenum]SHV77877.1 ESX-1 secretion-associated regulator EspR [Mycobacteroides abscessus subsp. bolletii]SII91170.1 ESX-1 secretion-associated regulator EspR [Mycobacteroides abscessus subsp. abscessus]SIK06269.1 ESX-1 secretion-associated regulator EspR [Mycobacteroides abscessus subsp. abscessus]